MTEGGAEHSKRDIGHNFELQLRSLLTKKDTQRQLCDDGLFMVKAMFSTLSRYVRYVDGWCLQRLEIQRTSLIT